MEGFQAIQRKQPARCLLLELNSFGKKCFGIYPYKCGLSGSQWFEILFVDHENCCLEGGPCR